MSTISTIFNSEDPVQSIFNFTDKFTLLLDKQKQDFMCSLERFFATYAYNEKILNNKHTESFTRHDIEVMKGVLQQSEDGNSNFRINCILATMTKAIKVSAKKLTPLNAIYQVRITAWCGEKNVDSWGWIEGRYIEKSEKLKEKLTGGLVELSPSDASPTILLALQRFSQLKENDKNVIVADLSLSALLDLMVFAHKMDIQPLMEELSEFYSCMKIETRNEEEKEIFRIVSNELEARKRALKAIQKIKITSERWPKDAVVQFCWYKDGQDESKYFDPAKPYASITWFSRRCCALSPKEQIKFYSHIKHFFSVQAFNKQTSKIPEDLQDVFGAYVLPFVLTTMQSKPSEKLRFLATIMVVANRSFPCIKMRHQIRILKICYQKGPNRKSEEITWVPQKVLHNRYSKDSDSTELNPINLESITPLNAALTHLDRDSNLGTPNQLVALLIIANEHFSYLGAQKVCDQIKDRLKKKSTQAQMSNALTEHQEHEAVTRFLKTIEQENLQKNCEAPSEADFALKDKYFEKNDFFSDVVKALLVQGSSLNAETMTAIKNAKEISSETCFEQWRKLKTDETIVAELKNELQNKDDTIIEQLIESLANGGSHFEAKQKVLNVITDANLQTDKEVKFMKKIIFELITRKEELTTDQLTTFLEDAKLNKDQLCRITEACKSPAYIKLALEENLKDAIPKFTKFMNENSQSCILC